MSVVAADATPETAIATAIATAGVAEAETTARKLNQRSLQMMY
jgi:hypothetical protein